MRFSESWLLPKAKNIFCLSVKYCNYYGFTNNSICNEFINNLCAINVISLY